MIVYMPCAFDSPAYMRYNLKERRLTRGRYTGKSRRGGRTRAGAMYMRKKLVIESATETDTRRAASELAQALRNGDTVLLRGEMGSGKSVFARGLAQAWGVVGHVTSPTFTIMQQYDGTRGRFYHFDLYRLSDPEELYAVGLDEYIGGDGLCAVEWPDNALPPLDGAYEVYIERADGDGRRITIIYPQEAAQ